MIKFLCPHCRQKLGVQDEYAGRRVRCSKCNQPLTVPAVQSLTNVSQSAVSSSTAGHTNSKAINVQTPVHTSPQMDELEIDNGPGDNSILQEDPREAAIRLARQQRAKAVQTSSKSKKDSPAKTARSGNRFAGFSAAELVPEFLRVPVGLVLAIVFMAAAIAVWVIAARASSIPLNFMALFVPAAAVLAIKLVTIERTFLLGAIGALIGGFGIAAGKGAIAKYVVIPYNQDFVKKDVLKDLPALLADERWQLKQGSVKRIAQDYDFITCIALISLVDEGKADPIQARRWAFDILRSSNKTNIYAELRAALGSPPDVPRLPEIEEADKPMFELVSQRLAEWHESETELQYTKKYFPALNCICVQCETDRLLAKPDTAFKFALLASLGLLDLLWILLPMGLAYISLSMD